MKLVIVIGFGILFLSSCSSEHSQNNSLITSEYIDKLSMVDAIFIIPGAGCRGCIGSAEQFSKNYIDSLNFGVIFTQVNSMKNLRFSMGVEFLQNKRVIIDTLNLIELEEMYYPTIYSPRTNDITVISPKEPQALSNLKVSLTNLN